MPKNEKDCTRILYNSAFVGVTGGFYFITKHGMNNVKASHRKLPLFQRILIPLCSELSSPSKIPFKLLTFSLFHDTG